MKILIAADGSSHTKRMLAYIAAHDEWLGPQHQYVVVNVTPSLPAHAASIVGRENCQAYYDEQTEQVFEPIRAFFSQKKLDTTYVGKHGQAGPLLAEMADAGEFDLVMLGSHGHGAFGNLVLGSVATQVLARCKRPVLIVR